MKMPSFWKLLCFPTLNHHSQKNNVHKSGKQKINQTLQEKLPKITGKASKMCSKKLCDEHVSSDYHFDVGAHVLRGGSGQRLIDGQRPTKRRCVQEIFHLNDENIEKHLQFSNEEDLTHHKHDICGFKMHRSFHSGYAPKLQMQPGAVNIESMYGYVPKVVQDVYASLALQGAQIDDFFNRLHHDNSLSKFCPKPQDLSMLHKVVSDTHSEIADKSESDSTSLILEGKPLNNVYAVDHVKHFNTLSSSANKNQIVKDSFENIWHCTEEVLY